MQLHEKISRLLKPYNRSVIAQAAGVTPETLHNAALGRCTPRLQTLKRIAVALGVDVSWMIDDSQVWPPVRVRPSTDLEAMQGAAVA
jgi:transcriptional regulator with XRE-family HTH domain